MEFKIKEDLLNAVLGYLATRPYQEVAGLIQGIHQGIEAIGEIIQEDKVISEDDQKQ